MGKIDQNAGIDTFLAMRDNSSDEIYYRSDDKITAFRDCAAYPAVYRPSRTEARRPVADA